MDQDNPWTDMSIKPIRLAKKSRADSAEFKMRPIRLSSRHDDDPLDNDHPTPSTSPSDDKIPPVSPKTPRRRSIQIKNLPIIESSPPKPVKKAESDDFIFAICLVEFHHVRGPEIQWWKSNCVPHLSSDTFKNLPFQSLPDGSHLFEETFSNFNLVYDFASNRSIDNLSDLTAFNEDPRSLETLFGCSCVRQINVSELTAEELERNKNDIKRSIVQKALVIINRKKPIFTKIKDKLSITTKSYFLQDNLSNFEVFENLFNNLNNEISFKDNEEFFINLNLKESLLQFRSHLLVIFKAILLEKKILIYSNNNLELLTKFQNNLISLVPNLVNNLTLSGCQLSDYKERFNNKLTKPVSLNTENRDSMLNFFGLPLKIFNTKGAIWNPYLPLQQLDQLSFPETKSFMIGCSNLLFVNQAQALGVDLLVNLDKMDLTFPNGMPPDLHLTSHDKNFVNSLLSNCMKDQILINESFIGSDDYIRFQFEDYLCSLLSTMRFHQYSQKFKQYPPGFSASVGSTNEDSNAYNGDLGPFDWHFIEAWTHTKNFDIWDLTCDEFIFNFVNPRHIQVDSVNQATLTSFFNNLNLKYFNEAPTIEPKANKFIEKESTDEPTDPEAADKAAAFKWPWGFRKKN